MIKQFLDFFKHSSENPDNVEHTLELATAALLFEVARADDQIDNREQSAIRDMLQSQFSLSAEELDALTETGKSNAKEAVDLIQFTRVLKEQYSSEQRTALMTRLWQVAFIDNDLNKYEESTIRQIADLLYVPHSVFIKTKLNVKAQQE
ncbi:tellurite resistance TerB family protein [Alteromonas oceanisediminis]|uniref:tellurite resistance TerB family protein n=1 Tax=Alteromonas oceanisediminis TaxID=2836180 RepID=UPI001BDA01F3|nr:TerB family tellurite resistance protein [Alteromonas oceanisediminis]MBT0587550.1 TerB family tellurite resistance protein [Alteromonas oceanisediminis]